ncbi:hypothetical protein SAMN05444157_3510 [Frankineae bacterium MT45]|nr:hypothetical protein SAMN05444157_3510 [Frankineae bacterium MT45]
MSVQRKPMIEVILIGVAVVGLAIDAYVHLDLASAFAHVKTSSLSQADLFRVEAAAAILAVVGLLIRPRRYTAGFATLVAAAGTAAVIVYRYVDVGAFGPVPNMYDPYWLPTGKWVSAIAEAAAAIASATLFVIYDRRARSSLAQPTRTAQPVSQ